PSLAGVAGVGIFGRFLNDGGAGVLGGPVNNGVVAADAQGEMDYFVNAGVWGGLPAAGSFNLITPLVGSLPVPSPFFTYVIIPGPVLAVQELAGYVSTDLQPFSEVKFPLDVEDDDTAALVADAPEPSSYLLFGVGLGALSVIARPFRRSK
ncbi:MAG: PEP-CTERM sorting domain-containing protein, partial [Acidobacteriaceae bacterium]|nr:PEP-CTERM sorting domain-containing protein [Acidobacteriaceae bacterium]